MQRHITRGTTTASWLLAAAFTLGTSGAMAWSGGDDSDPTPPGNDTGTGFPGVTDFAEDGPYNTSSTSRGGGWFSGDCDVRYPSDIGDTGLDHPVVVWGNGTGSSPSDYSALLNHWASHGFVVAAAETSNPGTGEEMLECLNILEEENASGSGTFAGNLDMDRVATSGHSQGGGGAIMAGQDERITATAPVQPYQLGLGHDTDSQSNQNGPMFLMSGSSDSIAGTTLNQGPIFNRANVPVFWGILQGAGHFEPAGNGGGFRGPSTAWLRYYLMDDGEAAAWFFGSDCVLCESSDWDVDTKDLN